MSELSDLILRAQTLKQEIRDRAKQEGESMVLGLFKPLFDLGVTGATWTQYTPGFNDGDPCRFGVHSFALYSPDAEPEEEGYWDYDSWTLKYVANDLDRHREKLAAYGVTENTLPLVVEHLNAVENVFHDAEEVLELMFGDGARVFVTPGSVQSEHYDCGY